MDKLHIGHWFAACKSAISLCVKTMKYTAFEPIINNNRLISVPVRAGRGGH